MLNDAQFHEFFDEKIFAELARLEKNNFWFVSRNKLIHWALSNYFSRAKNFLEIGCGTGFVLSSVEKRFPYLTCVGSEIFNAGLVFAHKRVKTASLIQMDARCIPYVDDFDIIGAFDVLEHISEDRLVLQQIYKALKPGGGLIITVPQHPFLWSKEDEYACHVRRYTRHELVHKVRESGFQILKITSFVSFLLPLMWMSRRLKRKKSIEHHDVLSELKIPLFLNTIFKIIMMLEMVLIRMGIYFSWGGSLLLIAKK